MKADGHSAAEITLAIRFRDMQDDYAVNRTGWTALEDFYREIQDKPWIEYQGELSPQDSPDWDWLRQAFTYDTGSLLKQYSGSVQAIFGQCDTVIPMQMCRERLNDILMKGATRDFEIQVVPGVGHDLFRTATGGELEFASSPGRVAGVHARITDWVRARVGMPPIPQSGGTQGVSSG
jgi:hypothetical protein